jgi:hypothetical protein
MRDLFIPHRVNTPSVECLQLTIGGVSFHVWGLTPLPSHRIGLFGKLTSVDLFLGERPTWRPFFTHFLPFSPVLDLSKISKGGRTAEAGTVTRHPAAAQSVAAR